MSDSHKPKGGFKEGRPNGVSRHATPAEVQAYELAKLLKNPDRDVYIPKRPAEGGATKTLRPPREMMKNVPGSSAGAGSGEVSPSSLSVCVAADFAGNVCSTCTSKVGGASMSG